MSPRGVIVVVVVSPALFAAAVGGCSESAPEASTSFGREELLDPVTCGRCHEDHFRDWSGSMHAYAADDPVFLAMNARLQRETAGAMGNFCVKCHAPMAVRDGKTTDGLNLAELEPKFRGVTCFFCHSVDGVEELHNNGLTSASDTTMRGPFSDAVPNPAHRSARSALHDQRVLDSSNMCGSCHDIVTPAGAHIERTFAEWKDSLFATETGQTCGSCHMKPSAGQQPIASGAGSVTRTMHSHTFAGIDRALSPWPLRDEQKREIQDFLDASLQASLCVNRRGPSAQLRVILDNVFAGHAFPSGATADRRVWVELVAKKDGQIVYQSGVVEDGKAVTEGPSDPDLWLLRDVVFDSAGRETHQFGLAACYESRLLPFPVTANALDPRFYQRNIFREFPADGSLVPYPDTVTMRVRVVPVGFDVLDDLIATGDLEPAVREQMEVMQVGPEVMWTQQAATPLLEQATGLLYECVTQTNQDFAANKYPPSTTNTCTP
ncbi:MAG TPA: multiheme c-type cytochrome [Labilithrix sp.]|jgi:hypothetical protein|nr:multiheme c-type cytochrome [Labilithrix sp.]